MFTMFTIRLLITQFYFFVQFRNWYCHYCHHAGNQACEQYTVCWHNEHQANKRHHEVIIFSGIISIQLTRRSILKFVMDQNIIRLTLPSSHLNWNRCNCYSTTDGVTVVMWRFYSIKRGLILTFYTFCSNEKHEAKPRAFYSKVWSNSSGPKQYT